MSVLLRRLIPHLQRTVLALAIALADAPPPLGLLASCRQQEEAHRVPRLRSSRERGECGRGGAFMPMNLWLFHYYIRLLIYTIVKCISHLTLTHSVLAPEAEAPGQKIESGFFRRKVFSSREKQAIWTNQYPILF